MNSYLRAIKKIGNKEIILNLDLAIQNIETAQNFSEVLNSKKLSGFSNHYRIKVENYIIGFVLEDEVVILVQFQHRKDIYKKFP